MRALGVEARGEADGDGESELDLLFSISESSSIKIMGLFVKVETVSDRFAAWLFG